MGKYLVPGTPLGGEHTAAEIRQIVTDLHSPVRISMEVGRANQRDWHL
jgi:hypothetical protein